MFANIAYASVDSFLLKAGNEIVNPLIKLFFAIAIIYFLYGMLEFILNQSNDEKKTDGKSHMFWGVVGIAIMLGVWGIISMIVNTIPGVSNNIKITDPNSGKVQIVIPKPSP